MSSEEHPPQQIIEMRSKAESLERLTTRLDVGLGRRLRMLSAARRISIQELVDAAVREYLARQESGS